MVNLKLSNGSLSRLEAQIYSSMSYLKNKYKPLLTISFPLAMCMLKSLQSCPTLCDPMDCSSPGSSVHGILQPRILEWVAMPSSTGSSWSRDWTLDPESCLMSPVLASGFFTTSMTWEAFSPFLQTQFSRKNDLSSHSFLKPQSLFQVPTILLTMIYYQIKLAPFIFLPKFYFHKVQPKWFMFLHAKYSMKGNRSTMNKRENIC